MIRTERLLLRRWRAEDREPFADLNADTEVRRYFPGTMSREASDAFADAVDRHWREHGWGLWAVDPTADFDHPHVDALAYPDLVRQVLYRLGHEQWRARLR